MRSAKRALAILIVVSCGSAEPTRAARPLVTEDTGTVESGHSELETAFGFGENPANSTGSVSAVVSAGLAPGIEVNVASQGLLADPDRADARGGIGDTSVGAKVRLFDEGRFRPAALLTTLIELPTGSEDRGLGRGEAGVGVVGAVSRSGRKLIATANLGYVFTPAKRELDRWLVAGSIEYGVTPRFWLVSEIVSTLERSDADVHVLRAGFMRELRSWLVIDAAAGFGLNRVSPRALATLGLTVLLF